MVNKYEPLVVCSFCAKKLWCIDESKETITCAYWKCKKVYKKKLHTIIGAELSMDPYGNFVLAFPEFNEKDTFGSMEQLQKELTILEKQTPDDVEPYTPENIEDGTNKQDTKKHSDETNSDHRECLIDS